MKFKQYLSTINEALPIGDIAKGFERQIAKAKKGDCNKIMSKVEKAFKDANITASEYDELTAAIGRKMDKLGENINEGFRELEGINELGIGELVSYSINMVAQLHIWHLDCKNGQKHDALKELYEGLQEELDGLGERFKVNGGLIAPVDFDMSYSYNPADVFNKCQILRDMTIPVIAGTSRPDMAAINDAAVDIQEVLDDKMFVFDLE